MNQNRISLLLALGLSAPLVAQTEDPRPKAAPAAAASLWQMQIGGISGWSAAKKAGEARDALQEIAGVDARAVDTTARGFFRSARPAKDLKKDVTAALKKAKLKLKSLVLARIKAPAGWSDSTGIRDGLRRWSGGMGVGKRRSAK